MKTGMKRNFLFILLILVFSMFQNYCSKDWTYSDRVEGFKKDNLRVYIRIDYEEDLKKNEIDKIMLSDARKRAFSLLKGYIKTSIKDQGKKETAFNNLNKAVKNGMIVYQNCNEKFCEAFVDFNIKIWKEKSGITKNNSSEKL